MVRQAILEQLRQAVSGSDEGIDLAGTALLLAGLEKTDSSLDKYHAHLAALAAETHAHATAATDLAVRVASLK